MRALARRAFRDARVRTIAFAYLFALYAYIQPVGYRDGYPTLASRVAFARSFADNKAVRLFYGEPHDLLTVSGYTAWRVGGTLAIFAAVFGLLAAVRALRTEEDAGRMELMLAGAVGRRTAYLASLAAIAAGVLRPLGSPRPSASSPADCRAGGSAYLALATVSVVPVCRGRRRASRASSRRRAGSRSSWEARPWACSFCCAWSPTRRAASAGCAGRRRSAGPRSCVPSPAPARSCWCSRSWRAAAAARRRRADRRAPRHRHRPAACARQRPRRASRLLSSPTAQALRSERTSLIAWLGGVGAFAYILGVVAKSSSSAGISKSVQPRARKARHGLDRDARPAISAFTFIFFVLAISLFACAQIGAARREEADEQLETLLALPVGRAALARRAAPAGDAGRRRDRACRGPAGMGGRGVRWRRHLAVAKLLEAGANCLPVALLFLGIAALAYAIVPRASAGIAYGLVTVAFLWYLVGVAARASRNGSFRLTPFAHIGLVPAQPFRAGARRRACSRSRRLTRARGDMGVPATRPDRTVRSGAAVLQQVAVGRCVAGRLSRDRARARSSRSCTSTPARSSGARILQVNATAYGGGVSELLRSAVPLLRDLGLDVDWKVIAGSRVLRARPRRCTTGCRAPHDRSASDDRRAYLDCTRENAAALDGGYDFVDRPRPAARRAAQHPRQGRRALGVALSHRHVRAEPRGLGVPAALPRRLRRGGVHDAAVRAARLADRSGSR